MKKIIKGLLVLILLCAVVSAGTYGLICYSNSSFREKIYIVNSEKISEPVRIIEISDIHQLSFGKNNTTLLDRVSRLKPDMIVLAGDIVDRNKPDIDYAVRLASDLNEIAPVYYGLGNHENHIVYGFELNREILEQDDTYSKISDAPWDYTPLIKDSSLLDKLDAAGIHVLRESSEIIEVNGNRISIAGSSCNASSFWGFSAEFIRHFGNEDTFNLLVCHRPEVLFNHEDETEFDMDLVLSGHTHGGVVILPYFGPLITTNGGFFPDKPGGMYQSDDATVIVGRGFAGAGGLPRINNKPELVIVDIK